MNDELNPLQRFIAKREREQAALQPQPPPLGTVEPAPKYPGIGRLGYIGGYIALVVFLASYFALYSSSVDQKTMKQAALTITSRS
jgi:predicted secreted protein